LGQVSLKVSSYVVAMAGAQRSLLKHLMILQKTSSLLEKLKLNVVFLKTHSVITKSGKWKWVPKLGQDPFLQQLKSNQHLKQAYRVGYMIKPSSK